MFKNDLYTILYNMSNTSDKKNKRKNTLNVVILTSARIQIFLP